MRLGARLWWGLVPLAVLLWGVGALTPITFPGLRATPVAVLALLPAVSFAREIAIAITLGCAVVALLIEPTARLRRWGLPWGDMSLGLIELGTAAMQADITGATGRGPDLGALLGDTLAGRALAGQFACLLLVTAVVGVGPRWLRWTALVVGLVGAAAPALAGHAGLTGPHTAAGVAIGAHVMAVSLWIGGLAVVVGLLVLDPAPAPLLLPRFSALALGCVIVLAETGLLTVSLTAGTLGMLFGSAYGSIVMTKAALLLVLIRLGWLQRRRVVDRMRESGGAPTRGAVIGDLTRMSGMEFLILGTALAGSVVLARIGPPPEPTTGFTALTIIALGVTAPLVLARMRPPRWRWVTSVPEVPVLALCVVVVETGGVGPLHRLVGGIGLLLEAAVLVAAGWLASGALARSRSAQAIALIGIPIALVAAWWLAGDQPWQLTVVAGLLAVASLAWAMRGDRARDSLPVAQAVDA